MLIPMFISVIAEDPTTKSPIVILKEVDGSKILPIWIGFLEAQAIASEMEGIKFPRPMTHDLLKNIFDMIGVEIKKIEISALKNNTFYALIHIIYKEKDMEVDARPSDALALSLRVGAPIYVAEEVIKKSGKIDFRGEPEDKSKEGEEWREILENIDPEDFGNS